MRQSMAKNERWMAMIEPSQPRVWPNNAEEDYCTDLKMMVVKFDPYVESGR